MGLIFDNYSANLYKSWQRSPKGRSMDGFVERLIPELLEPAKYERVLDIGCGTGNHLLHFRRLGLNINGIDASPYMIDLAKKRLGNRCTLNIGMAEDLPYEDNEFDFALLINTLEFLDDPIQALREAGRVARRKVLIVVINSLSLDRAQDRFKGLFRESIHKYIKPYNLWELKSCVQRAYGLVPIEWRGEKIWPFSTERISRSPSDPDGLSAWPFGSFIGLSATLKYSFKTDNLPLKIRVNKREQSIAGGIPAVRH